VKKLVLINPHEPGRFGEESISVIVQMPLNLAYLAAMTPPHWEIDVVDENIESAIDARTGGPSFGQADLVAITGVTHHASRAYDIATACRRAGLKTVMGGIHATTMADEAARYFDSVVKFDAEPVWGRLLEDVERDALQPVYDGGAPDLGILKSVWPDRELMRKKYNYEFSSIVTTKGCPLRCEFCSVPTFQPDFRQRPHEDVLDEMEATTYKGLMFAEDNFYGHSKKSNERARNLFQGMVDRGVKKNWFGFTALNVSEDPVALAAMEKSGCFGMLLGIESTNPEVLKQMNKKVNLHLQYKEALDRIHGNGLIVWGSVIFGADGDDQHCFKRMVDFIYEQGIDALTFGIECALPRTPLHKRLSAEGRLFRNDFPHDWRYYDTAHLTHRLKGMTLEEFIEGMQYVYDSVYTTERLRERFRISLRNTGNARNSLFAYRVGQDWQQVFEQVLVNLRIMYDSGAYWGNYTAHAAS
jgi:radical SAM superfamily enzyme YgiQ (UPF0313 family)